MLTLLLDLYRRQKFFVGKRGNDNRKRRRLLTRVLVRKYVRSNESQAYYIVKLSS